MPLVSLAYYRSCWIGHVPRAGFSGLLDFAVCQFRKGALIVSLAYYRSAMLDWPHAGFPGLLDFAVC